MEWLDILTLVSITYVASPVVGRTAHRNVQFTTEGKRRIGDNDIVTGKEA